MLYAGALGQSHSARGTVSGDSRKRVERLRRQNEPSVMLIKRRRRPMPGRGASSLRGCGRSRDDETRAARP